MNRLLTAALVLTVLACSPKAPEVGQVAEPPPAQEPTAAPAAPPPASQTGGVGTLSSRGTQTNPAPAGPSAGSGVASSGGSEVSGAGLRFTLPEGWQRQQPSSNMRMAQAAIPGAAGEGLLTVFFFGEGGGGGVDANLDRWAGQIEGEAPSRQSFEANGLRVTWIEKAGTLQPSGFGMGPDEPQPGSRLFGAVIEGPGGPWFFKATGPGKTLAGERDAFLAMVRGARLQ